ncbi:helix-hairpin-helix domain-containing protein [Actinoplanes xinjiangensis]|uniref:helix-hairpin-helix domain-containing protein n=1 Tax=Actinoplanes xinjiangensis TaxID=512350 RepID=UPI00343314CF
MTWTPPDPVPYRPGLAWKLGHSAWLLAPFLTFGCGSVGGFLYVGLRARRPAWWIAGIVYSVAAMALLFISDSLPKDSDLASLTALLWVLTWVVSVGHAVAINSSWLRWLVRRRRGSAYPQDPPPWKSPPPSPPLPAPVQQALQVPPPAVPLLLDVNAAGLDELAALPAIGPERAARAVAARRERNGFATVAEFAAAAELAPHQFAAVRDRLTCRPPAPEPERLSEREHPYGRIVDI